MRTQGKDYIDIEKVRRKTTNELLKQRTSSIDPKFRKLI
jgi:hypothetical protein